MYTYIYTHHAYSSLNQSVMYQSCIYFDQSRRIGLYAKFIFNTCREKNVCGK